MSSSNLIDTELEQKKIIYSNCSFRRKHIFRFLIALLYLIGASIIAYFGLHTIEADIQKFGPAIFWNSGKYFILAFVFFIIFFIIQLIRSIPPSKKVVEINDEGILIKTRKRSKSLNWNEISKIWLKLSQNRFLGLSTKREQYIKLEDYTGKTIKLDTKIQDFDDLLQTIRKRFYLSYIENNFPKQNDSNNNFGAIEKTAANELQIGKKRIAISEGYCIKVSNGNLFLVFHNNKKNIKIPIQKIANLDVLLGILKHQGIDIHSN